MVYTNDNACVALTSEGFLHNWGDANYGGTSDLTTLTNIEKVFQTQSRFKTIR